VYAGRYRGLLLIVVALLLVWLVVSCLRWHAQLKAARSAVQELADCRMLAAHIEALRANPTNVSLHTQTQQQINTWVQRAAEVAEIPKKEIRSVLPQPVRRLAKTPHVQHPTTVEIWQTSLGQLSRFLSELSALEAGLQPTSIRLTAPRTPPRATQTEVWTCELTLTYLVFSPE